MYRWNELLSPALIDSITAYSSTSFATAVSASAVGRCTATGGNESQSSNASFNASNFDSAFCTFPVNTSFLKSAEAAADSI